MKLHVSIASLFVAASVLAACERAQAPAPQPANVSTAQTQAHNIQKWAGNWSGTWSGDCVTTMKISNVTDTNAVVVHEYGDCGDLKAGISADNAARIDGSKMMTTYLGFDIEYAKRGANSVDGVMRRRGARVANGQFTRN